MSYYGRSRKWLSIVSRKENRFRRAVWKLAKGRDVAPKRKKLLLKVTNKQTRTGDFI